MVDLHSPLRGNLMVMADHLSVLQRIANKKEYASLAGCLRQEAIGEVGTLGSFLESFTLYNIV